MTQISRDDLEARFLAHLKAEPGCEGVTKVDIIAGHRLGSSEGWKVVDWKGEADDLAVEDALKSGYRKFDGQFEIKR